MKYSIALKDLPFEPERRQVIYVENQYDERINTIIKDNYERLKWSFKRTNLDFVYLPMFFNDEEINKSFAFASLANHAATQRHSAIWFLYYLHLL